MAIVNLTLDRISHLFILAIPCWTLGGLLGWTGFFNGWLVFSTLWLGAAFFYFTLVSKKVDIENKAVLITGCDTGFGHELAKKLDDMGFIVFAGCLLAEKGGKGAEMLKNDCSKRLNVIQMDVTSEYEILNVRKKVDEMLPNEAYLWAIVNNAGIGTFGDVEWMPIESYRKITEVNVFGMLSVTKAFLPLIRRSQGRIINVASMLGRMAVPMRSPYCLTKFAVGALSDCLRQEMKSWGVEVIVLEPGNYIAATSIFTEEAVEQHGKEMWKTMSDEAKADYGEEKFNERIEIMKSYVTKGETDLSLVIEAFVDAITQKYPQARYQPMNLYYKTRIFCAWHFVEWIYDHLYVGCLKN